MPSNEDRPQPETADDAGEVTAPLAVVALGASAGGLEPLEEFFAHVPDRSGIAFVVVTHQHPQQASLLPELLARKTSMHVVEVHQPTPVRPDHVYLARPGWSLTIVGGVLHPAEVAEEGRRMHIDAFLRSLAQDQRDRAAAVILSGTGTDGALGVKEIKGELGMVMVQDDWSAQYNGMPRAAVATHVVDFVLPAAEMPARLLQYFEALPPIAARSPRSSARPVEALRDVFALIRERTGHDFSRYKNSTVARRIDRRMSVHSVGSTMRYVQYLRDNPDEVDTLFRELLIGVTSFFRDPEAWEALRLNIDELLASKPADHVVRAWVAGCSTGEEAYSLAMVLREAMDQAERTLAVQIFATDIDDHAIEVARAGSYPHGITNDVAADQLARFFTRKEDVFRVNKEIREMIVFAEQNLIADPPFTKLDLVLCRNLLIYLESDVQRRVLPMFHYALRSGGLLVLGTSESVGLHSTLFASLDKRRKIFRRTDAVGPPVDFPAEVSSPRFAELGTAATGARGRSPLDKTIERMFLEELVPPTVVCRERGEIVHVHGRTGRFLEPAPGLPAAANLYNMAREGLPVALSAGIRQASTGKPSLRRGVPVRTNGDVITIDLRVERIERPAVLEGLYRISFENPAPVADEGGGGSTPLPDAPGDRFADLERELQHTRENHQSTIEDLETANEELKSTNEELQSTNEELQSANEELETSKEEMQSLNEELQAVNAELQGKLEELSRANDDMKNLLNGTDIATVFLDEELNIKRFTEQAKQVIRLIASDVGRFVGDLVPKLQYDRLVEDAREVLRTLVYKEIEVRGEDNAWYLLRILPYRTTDNVIDGLVLTFVDVTTVTRLQADQARLVKVLRASPVELFSLDDHLRIRWVGDRVFGRESSSVQGTSILTLVDGEDARRLEAVLKRTLAEGRGASERIELIVDGSVRQYDLYLEPRREQTAAIVGVDCVATRTATATGIAPGRTS